jgi:hypothetical protein
MLYWASGCSSPDSNSIKPITHPSSSSVFFLFRSNVTFLCERTVLAFICWNLDRTGLDDLQSFNYDHHPPLSLFYFYSKNDRLKGSIVTFLRQQGYSSIYLLESQQEGHSRSTKQGINQQDPSWFTLIRHKDFYYGSRALILVFTIPLED